MNKHDIVFSRGISLISIPFLWLFSLTFFPCSGQHLSLIKEIKINKPVALSTDKYSNLLIGDNKGNIYKVDSTGNITYTYSPQHIAAISSIEAWQTLQVFVFYKDVQAFTLLNRFLIPLAGYPFQFNRQLVGFARAASIAADETVWLFDDGDFSLKKFNMRSQNISLHTPLELILDASTYQINFMREYQNMLYINDKNSGILVFDNLGNYKKKLPFPQLDFFSFHNNELYFTQQGKIHFIDLYTFARREINLPAEKQIKQAVLSGKILFLIAESSLIIYKLS